jgi:hypothetical protein
MKWGERRSNTFPRAIYRRVSACRTRTRIFAPRIRIRAR